jgi:hypothetical protein
VDDDGADLGEDTPPREGRPGDDRDLVAGLRVLQAASKGPTTLVVDERLDGIAAVIDAARAQLGERGGVGPTDLNIIDQHVSVVVGVHARPTIVVCPA